MKSIVNIKIGALVASCILWSSVLFPQEKGAFLDWVIQTEGSGNTLGNRVFTVDKDASNNIIVCGGFNETLNLNPLGEDVVISSWDDEESIPYLAKYDENGQLLWVNTFREPGMDIIGFNTLKTDAQGNIYVFAQLSGTGDFDPSATSHFETSTHGVEYFVASYDTDGNFRWVFKLEKLMTAHTVIQDITVNNATQSLTITGFFTNEVNFNPDATDPVVYNTDGIFDKHIFLANYSLEGELNWVNTFDNSRSTLGTIHDYYRVASDEEGNVFLSGLFMDSLNLATDVTTPYLITTNEAPDGFIAKFNLDGMLKWQSVMKSPDFVFLTDLVASNSEVFLTGSIRDNVAFYSSDLTTFTSLSLTELPVPFIARYNSNTGDFISAFHVSTDNNTFGRGTKLYKSGANIYLLGNFTGNGSLDFNPSSTNENWIANNSHHQETFLAKYTQEGEFKWAFGMPGGTFTEGKGIVALNDGIVIVGEYRGSPDVSAYGETPVIISTDFSPSINYHTFIAKYSQGILNNLNQENSNPNIKVFPNPSKTKHTLTFTVPAHTKVNIDLFDIQGRKLKNIFNRQVSDGIFQQVIDVSQLEEGVYFYGVELGGKQQMVRFVR